MILVIILILLLVIFYIQQYLSYSKEFSIIQASISKITCTYLFEKNPIIITEPLVNPSILTSTLFKYLYIHKNQKSVDCFDTFMRIRTKYLVLFPEHDMTLQIAHPKTSKIIKSNNVNKIQYVDIILRKNQTMILPMYWWFQIPKDTKVNAIYLHDIISYVFGKLLN